ncbi:MAG: methyltransferase domain-containing protein [Desulfuromonadales bacterium]
MKKESVGVGSPGNYSGADRMTEGYRTKAQQVYAEAYRNTAAMPGIPDRKIIAGMPEKGLSILSLGSGSGADLWFLANENEIHALDSSSSAIAEANAHGLKGQLADLEQALPFEDAVFDIVVCKDLIEHLIAPDKLMSEIHRVLKSSGRLVLSVPNHFYLPFRLRILFGGNLIWRSLVHDHSRHFDEWDYMHIRFFTWRGLQRFLDITNFHIERTFWDFGLAAHYVNLDMYNEHLHEKYAVKPLTPKARLFFYAIYPTWQLYNLVFPRRLRHFIVGLAPGLLCAGYYLHCQKQGEA